MPPRAVRRGASSAAPRQTNAADATSNPPVGSAPQPPSNTTAGAAPARAPVQRLQSLKKRTPSGSIGPSARPAAAPPGPGEPAKPTLKYKPRAVGRRSKEERDAIEKLEAERNRERLAEVAAMRRGRGGQRGRGLGRGRGGPMGGGGRRGRGGRFGPDSRASSMSRSRSVIDMGSGAASRDVSSDESDAENLLPIDRIELESDEEVDYVADTKKGKIPARYADRERGLRPVRVERLEHEERVVSVNMESSTSKPAESPEEEVQVQETRAKTKVKADDDDDALFVRDDDEIEPRVKAEPVDEDHVMTDAVPHVDEAAAIDDGFLPAQKVKVRRRLTPKTPEPEPEPVPPIEAPVVKDPKSLLRTKEDIEEYERHAKDLETILELLSVEPKPKPERPEPPAEVEGGPAATETTKEKEEKDKEEEEEPQDKLSGQLFLMQFPPMTPNLVIPGTGSGDSIEEATPESAAQAVPGGTRPGEAAVKRETGDVEILDGADGPTTKEPSKIVTATDWQLQAGRVGKLNVHKSGRVTMDWGGISFELDRGTAVDFLQEALIVSAPEEGMSAEENRVWAMGQLSGKFTVTPNWEAML